MSGRAAPVLLSALLLLCFFARRPGDAGACPTAGSGAVPAAVLSGTREETGAAGPGTGQPLRPLLARLAECETATAGSARRLAALVPPLRRWAEAEKRPGVREGELRSFLSTLTEEERQGLRDKLGLLRAVNGLPAESLSELLEEGGFAGAVPADPGPLAAFLERFRELLDEISNNTLKE